MMLWQLLVNVCYFYVPTFNFNENLLVWGFFSCASTREVKMRMALRLMKLRNPIIFSNWGEMWEEEWENFYDFSFDAGKTSESKKVIFTNFFKILLHPNHSLAHFKLFKKIPFNFDLPKVFKWSFITCRIGFPRKTFPSKLIWWI
jgi:hypothetical protein